MKKLFACVLCAMLLMVLAVPVMASAESYVIDDADLLTPYEERQLEAELARISSDLNMDIVVATTNDTLGKTSQAYADDLYDYSGYGDNGVLWLIDMQNRQSTISTCGKAIEFIPDDSQELIHDNVVPLLQEERYFDAAMEFASLCELYCTFDWGMAIIISLVVGFVIALIATGIMRGQLKSVYAKLTASDYVIPGSLALTESRDLFLYRHVSRRAKPKDNGSSSGTHSSSSGRSHGGSSRSF